jgi:hypothetical protein
MYYFCVNSGSSAVVFVGDLEQVRCRFEAFEPMMAETVYSIQPMDRETAADMRSSGVIFVRL